MERNQPAECLLTGVPLYPLWITSLLPFIPTILYCSPSSMPRPPVPPLAVVESMMSPTRIPVLFLVSLAGVEKLGVMGRLLATVTVEQILPVTFNGLSCPMADSFVAQLPTSVDAFSAAVGAIRYGPS